MCVCVCEFNTFAGDDILENSGFNLNDKTIPPTLNGEKCLYIANRVFPKSLKSQISASVFKH